MALAVLGAVFAFGVMVPARADDILSNGNFEAWGNVAGTPPAGCPTSWKANGVYQLPGLATGSTFSAAVGPKGVLFQAPSEPLSSFELSFDFAATDPGITNGRSLHLILLGGEAPHLAPLIVMRATQGASAGVLDLQLWDGTVWQPIATGLTASVWDSTSNSFSSVKTYSVKVAANLASNSYSISYGSDGDMHTSSGLAFFATPPNGMKLGEVYFEGNSSATLYAVDNVTLTNKAAQDSPTTTK